MDKIIGIDLGTTNSAAAIMIDGKPTIIPSAEGLTPYGKMFPSIVSFMNDNRLIVGELARKQLITNPDRTITAIKRKMGTDYRIKINGKEYIPQEISAMILKKIKQDAETFLGKKIEKAVITVPAYFNDNQRTATKDAAIITGFNMIRLINEPTAASLAYGLDKVRKKLKIAVLNLGSGTFDVTILEMCDSIFEVISTAGNTQLGGIDMDSEITDYLVQEFKKKIGIDLKDDRKVMGILRDAAERAKISLSSKPSTTINLSFNISGGSEVKLNKTLTRHKLEELIQDILQRMDGPMKQALADSKLRLEDIDRVVLVGGPTRMPIVREYIKKFFGKEPEKGVDPMECAAMGAAIQGSVLSGEIKDLVLLDVTPLSLGIETSGAVFTKLIERNTTIPVEKSQVFTTAEDFQTTMAIHVLQGERTMAADNITLSVFNLTGIPPAPRRESQIEVAFDIDANGILNVSAEDLETGRKQKITVTGATKLMKEEIDRMIKEAEKFTKADKKRKERIDVCNRADALIHAAEKTLKNEGKKIPEDEKEKIENVMQRLKETLESDDINRIKKCSEALTEVMDETGMKIHARARANALIQVAEKMMKSMSDKVPEREKDDVEKAIEKLKEMLKSCDADKIKKQTEELTEMITLLEADYKDD